ncbi:phosphate ABC transporter permease subunit PstC [Halobacterium litoreum]|uniref:Phosphate transport system permease protein n=1 Tax=Halobacterium litoreum TaxID=2039234 RepID=A0ABD5NHM9_9EURY|nr:phosphate ABC transporter permease subunit PstC [Halobacterium litoreum]UHH12584.1 phosphate ABC transporter permease subunit PstC [Halobacterium litoreum]
MSEESTTPDFAGGARARSAKEQSIKWTLFACAALSVLVTVGIVLTLLFDALSFFRSVPLTEFFLSTTWSPSIEETYGVLPLLAGTLIVTVISALIAIPVGTAAAVYLSEYASDRVRSVLKPGLEILAGIPTVVYGYFALVYLTPFLDWVGLPVGAFSTLSASIMVGVMIIPMVSSLSEDAMSSVPDSLRQGAYGLGATKYEVSTGVVIPGAVSGIFSSYILALSRAIGETMIVAVAMGMRARMPTPGNLEAVVFKSGETMTVAMVELVGSEIAGGTVAYKSLFAIGLTLFVVTFVMNLLSNWVASRYREEYQ